MGKPTIHIIAAFGTRTRAIGNAGKDLWDIPEDHQRFSRLTAGHPVIMGRRTWEAIPRERRPLYGRINIVLSGSGTMPATTGMYVVTSEQSALEVAMMSPGGEEIFIIGGAMIYELFLPLAHVLHLTEVDDDREATRSPPHYEDVSFKEKGGQTSVRDGFRYKFRTLERAA